MAYSVLPMGKGQNSHILYCSLQQKGIMSGTEKEMDDVKEVLDRMDQIAADKKHLKTLRTKYVNMLVAGGHTHKEAASSLQKSMPSLFSIS